MSPVQKNISPNKTVRRTTGRRHHHKEQMPVRTPSLAANGFLKQRFLPVTDASLPSASKCTKIQDSFFQSLQYLCDLHGLQTINAKIEAFPYNICIAYEEAKKQLKERDCTLKLFITATNELPVLCTGSILDTGCCLYYIPLYPLDKLRQAGKTKLFELLLSAFAYLHKAGVPLCDNSSFIGYEMETIREYVIDSPGEWEADDYEEVRETMNYTFTECDGLCKMIANPSHLKEFGARIKQIQPVNNKEELLIQAISKLYTLYKDFAQKKITAQVYDGLVHPEIEDRVYMEQYLSFFWGEHTWFDEQLNETINVHLQETTIADEPIAIQLFDKPQQAVQHDLEFETRFLECINQLNVALYAR